MYLRTDFNRDREVFPYLITELHEVVYLVLLLYRHFLKRFFNIIGHAEGSDELGERMDNHF